MTSQLAEDLLKSRTIQELKHVVHELAKDGDLKKTELQGMVGSQYQEFIQSADKIIEMKKQASIVSSELFNFWSSSEKMLKSIESVLSIQNMNHARCENNFRELIAGILRFLWISSLFHCLDRFKSTFNLERSVR
jgi:hypothetical protein